jgi:predicted RNase H-like nuclease
MQLVYMTAVDRSLGVLRVFPLPLLERVYTINAPQFGWPAIANGEMLEDGRRAQRETLRKDERADQLLQEITERADDVEVLSSAKSLREFLQSEMASLRQQLEAPAPPA